MSYFLKLIEKLNLNDRNTDLVNYYFYDLNQQLSEIFYNRTDEKLHSKIVGSYSRNTNIVTQNINIIFELPTTLIDSKVCPCEMMIDNLHNYEIRSSSHSNAIEVVTEKDISFDILGVYPNSDGTFTYRVSNKSGLWSIMDPITENIAFKSFYREYNYSPISISKIFRLWLSKTDINISGYLSDTFIYHFYRLYSPNDIIYMSPEAIFKLFIKFLIKLPRTKLFWKAPGSNHNVPKTDNFHEKAELTLELIESLNSEAWETIFESTLISA